MYALLPLYSTVSIEPLLGVCTCREAEFFRSRKSLGRVERQMAVGYAIQNLIRVARLYDLP